MKKKRIQNIDSKDDPDLQNRMDTWTEKIQEMFNKDLEELKNNDVEHNNLKEKHTGRNQ